MTLARLGPIVSSGDDDHRLANPGVDLRRRLHRGARRQDPAGNDVDVGRHGIEGDGLRGIGVGPMHQLGAGGLGRRGGVALHFTDMVAPNRGRRLRGSGNHVPADPLRNIPVGGSRTSQERVALSRHVIA